MKERRVGSERAGKRNKEEGLAVATYSCPLLELVLVDFVPAANDIARPTARLDNKLFLVQLLEHLAHNLPHRLQGLHVVLCLVEPLLQVSDAEPQVLELCVPLAMFDEASAKVVQALLSPQFGRSFWRWGGSSSGGRRLGEERLGLVRSSGSIGVLLLVHGGGLGAGGRWTVLVLIVLCRGGRGFLEVTRKPLSRARQADPKILSL